MGNFKALVIDKNDSDQQVEFRNFDRSELMDGELFVKVEYSTVNYKDALAITGKAPIIRNYPLIPGVDFSGEVVECSTDEFKAGDKIVSTGWGVGENHHGGFAEYAQIPAKFAVKIPDTLTTKDAMAVGTGGFTGMLCVMALADQGLKPDDGKVIITGAGGGVGGFALRLLSKRGFETYALTGKVSEKEYFKSLGAADIVDRDDFSHEVKPLSRATWAGAVDAVGSKILANVISQMQYDGVVAACGLAQGADLPVSVMPFILRGVKLIGVESVMVPKDRRIIAWDLLAKELDKNDFDDIASVKPLDDVIDIAHDLIAGNVRGRVIIKI